ncbi:hypothetical protein [Enhygromyxa salina]|nr:hypothetical protein [Enhygromyxa salina]
MNVFELIKRVLDEAFDDIQGTRDEKFNKIRAAQDAMSQRYQSLGVGGPGPSYGDPATRFAYVFRYVTSHANLVAEAIANSAKLRDVFAAPTGGADTISVACLGGGPGSDFIGVLKYMIKNGASASLLCHLLDKEGAWGDSWSGIGSMLEEIPFRVSTHFQALDVTLANTWDQQRRYLKADIFTLIYFASELWGVKDASEVFFKHVFGSAKPGAHILYIDNDSDIFTHWFDTLAAEVGLEEVQSWSEDARMPSDEQKDVLASYLTHLGWPKMKARVAVRVLQKRQIDT